MPGTYQERHQIGITHFASNICHQRRCSPRPINIISCWRYNKTVIELKYRIYDTWARSEKLRSQIFAPIRGYRGSMTVTNWSLLLKTSSLRFTNYGLTNYFVGVARKSDRPNVLT